MCVRDGEKGEDGVEDYELRTMHVQSISNWAPANIGPYSQALRVGHTTWQGGSHDTAGWITQLGGSRDTVG